MELIRNNIHMNVVKKNLVTTFYVNNEGTVNEASPAIKSIICRKEKVMVENVSVRNNQIIMDGNLAYELLYYPEDSENVCGIEGETAFRETVKIPDVEEGEGSVRLEIISASVKLIDGRNYLYKIGVMAYITVEQLEDLECTKAVPDEEVMVMDKTIDVLEIKADKREMFRISEQLEVPTGKAALEKIVWKDVHLNSINTRILDRQMEVTGELSVFILYIPDVENGTEQWLETTVDFNGIVEMEEAIEGMISYVDAKLHTVNLSPALNPDNEMKLINLSALLKMDVKLFQEEEQQTIVDLYSPNKNIISEYEEKNYYRLLVKNQARTKETIKIDIDEAKGPILQLCNGNARLQIENIITGDNSIKILGKIMAGIIYVSSDDKNPICNQQKEIAFEHIIDAEDIIPQDKYYIDWRTEQITSNMISGKQVEIKVVVAMEVLAFREEREQIIKSVKEEELSAEEIANMPLIKGYVVQQGDTLWQLAKKNRTTMDEIIRMNDLQGEQIKKGNKLLIVKSCQ